ncbi:hypothetical protein SISSUDRAFT_1059708 [Sistotremastrum suecicum HHB10207 ss-3]|uniref:Bromo domain-containing protein n=1 Tax=Sistotremastrum suecicum HHB10207 ss-3 TaxID=1314776 RepID=A0A166FZ78_9AGAM|nr:hypothetical protein SISSUDRAFT_1059708 [Sistotremastrum suecicum HHB10207 ss-3]
MSTSNNPLDPELCSHIYEQLMASCGLQITEEGRKPRARVHLRLAQIQYQDHVTELKELIFAEEAKFRNLASEIDDIRSGLWDDNIKAELHVAPSDSMDIVPSKPLVPEEETPLRELPPPSHEESPLAQEPDELQDVDMETSPEPKEPALSPDTRPILQEIDHRPKTMSPPAPLSSRSASKTPAPTHREVSLQAPKSPSPVPDRHTDEPPTVAVNKPLLEVQPEKDGFDGDSPLPELSDEHQSPEHTAQPQQKSPSPTLSRTDAVVSAEEVEDLAHVKEESELEAQTEMLLSEEVPEELEEPEQVPAAPEESLPAMSPKPESEKGSVKDVVVRRSRRLRVSPSSARSVPPASATVESERTASPPAEPMSTSKRVSEPTTTQASPAAAPSTSRSSREPKPRRTTRRRVGSIASEQIAEEDASPHPQESKSTRNRHVAEAEEESKKTTELKSPTGRKRKASEAGMTPSEKTRNTPRDDSEAAEEGLGTTSKRSRTAGSSSGLPPGKRFYNMINMVHTQISQHRNGNIFHNPIKDSEAPDYHDIVKRPMDLKTLRLRAKDGTVNDSRHYQRDLYLMFLNAMMYNRPTSEIYKMTEEMLSDTEGFILTFRQTEGWQNN